MYITATALTQSVKISSSALTSPKELFDNVAAAKYAVPSHWDIGKVYKRLILGISREKEIDVIDALFEAYNSFVSDKIDDYNSSFYYDAPQNILNAALFGEIE